MKVILIFTFLISFNIFSQEQKNMNKRIIYKYKKEEYFDLGDMTIDGNILSPGDISAKVKQRKIFDYHFPDRTSFDDEMRIDIQEID